ncbi:MAG: cytoskeletal protein CcmA (bactofilin family) [Candidatus Latescibacterota bacterium]|jgi:cytoskeletal protein CcmA (bactofilin family)
MQRKTKETVNTVVGKGSVLEGHFEVTDGIRVDGILRGSLTSSGALVVGVSGDVDAHPIRVRDAIIAGRVRGAIEASHLVKLESSAEMIGDITAQVLIIEEGAVLHGVCDAGEDRKVALPEARKPVEVGQAVG